MKTIFDENGLLNISDVILNHSSYKAIMEDGIVTDVELKDQTEAAIASLRYLESICNEEQQEAILNTMSELGVLYAVYQNYQNQNKTL